MMALLELRAVEAGYGSIQILHGASLHVNAVLPEARYQEYCVAETPINTRLTVQRLPLEADGCVAVPTAPGLGVELDEDVLASLRVDR